MSRILFLVPGVNYVEERGGVSGGGWVSSLIEAIPSDHRDAIGIVSLCTSRSTAVGMGFQYYPVLVPRIGIWKKVRRYYGGYRKESSDWLLAPLQHIISDFAPDVIYLFGVENPFAVILGHTEIPVLLHLQGLLYPCSQAYYPAGMSRRSFLSRFSVREHIFRNGFVFQEKDMAVRARRELELLKAARFVMGRTGWDRKMMELHAPQARYFHVDEILRAPFYTHAGQAQYRSDGTLRLVSTLSETVYKGLDVILKTASLLCRLSVDFEWRVIGVAPDAALVRTFERVTGVDSASVHVAYLGIRSAEEICTVELESDVYIHPSYIDNSPNSLCEAQMLGLPCIGTAVGGIPTLIKDGETGLLVPSNGVNDLCWAIRRLAADAEYRKALGKAAVAVAEQRHDRSRIVAEIDTAIQSVL